MRARRQGEKWNAPVFEGFGRCWKMLEGVGRTPLASHFPIVRSRLFIRRIIGPELEYVKKFERLKNALKRVGCCWRVLHLLKTFL